MAIGPTIGGMLGFGYTISHKKKEITDQKYVYIYGTEEEDFTAEKAGDVHYYNFIS